jgi:hypothetical protein
MSIESLNAPTRPTVRLIAIAEREATKRFECYIELVTRNQALRYLWIARADFDDKRLLLATLKNAGLETSQDAEANDDAIHKLIASIASAEKWIIAASTGWRDNSKQFVLPYTIVGKGDPDVRVLHPDAGEERKRSKLGCRGTLRGWQRRVAGPARHSSRMVLGICAAFGAQVLKFAQINSFGLQISGDSKTGKSTGLVAAASVAGFSKESDLPNFRATDAALGELPAEFNDMLFPLNETKLSKGNDRVRQERMRDLAYGVAEGVGVTYSRLYTQQPKLQWRTIVLANSEESANDLAQRTGADRTGGEAIRWVDLPAVRKGRRTIFDLVPAEQHGGDEVGWARQTCREMREAVADNHGMAAVKFLREAVKDPNCIAEELNRRSQFFVMNVARGSDSPPVKHLATSFGHIYAAGRLAIQFGILPWHRRLVLRCVKRCYFDARRAMRTPEEVQRRGLKRLIKMIDGGRMVAFQKMRAKPKLSSLQSADGYVVMDGVDRKVVIRAKRFKAWFSDRRQPRLVVDWLLEHEAISPAAGHEPKPGLGIVWAETQKTWPDGTRVRSIVINLTADVRRALPR